MNIIKHTIEIKTKPETLYNYITKPWDWHEWHPSSLCAESNVNVLDKGDHFEEDIQIQLFDLLPIKIKRHLKYTVLAATPHKHWEVKATGRNTEINIRYDFEPCEHGVEFTRTLSFQIFGPLALATNFLTRRNKVMSLRALEQLTEKMESMA